MILRPCPALRATWRLLRTLAAATLSIALAAVPSAASGADVAGKEPYPSRSIRIVIGQQPGSPSDVMARLVAQKLADLWKEGVVVENQAGASGTIGAEQVARAPPDGYTLLMASHSNMVFAKVASSSVRYDPLVDFAPIGRIAHVPFVLVVYQKVPARTFPEFVGLAKKDPGRLTYATAGSGTMSAMGMELLKAATGTDLLAVHYRGASSALVDVLAGRVDAMFADYAAAAPHIRSGTLRLLGAGGDRRSAALPDLPTLAELGVRDFAVNPWYGLLAPAKTPPEVLAKLSDALSEIRKMPDVRARLDQLGFDPLEDTPAQFRMLIGSEIDKYSELVKRMGLKPE